jgi:hypothetical protein
LPFLKERFPKVQGYAEATLAGIYDAALASARAVELNWLESTVFLNRGASFEARPLPVEAQFAPASSICVADMDGDGDEDLFLGQNFFAVSSRDIALRRRASGPGCEITVKGSSRRCRRAKVVSAFMANNAARL